MLLFENNYLKRRVTRIVSSALFGIIGIIGIEGIIYNNTHISAVDNNDISYTMEFIENTVENMPANILDGSSNNATATIPSGTTNTPTRPGYKFVGWCDQPTTKSGNNDTCATGHSYQPGETYPLSSTTGSANKIKLYAVWESSIPPISNTTCATPLPGAIYMQDITSSNKTAIKNAMNEGAQYYLIDNRDNKGYCVSKEKDGNIWMTQNLDLELTTTGAKNPITGAITPLTSDNTDLNTSGSSAYNSGYTNTGGVITWAPASTAATANHTISGTSVSNWTDNNTAPYTAEGGGVYIYTSNSDDDDATYNSFDACTTAHSEEECAHYHRGNFYNWTAAIASNASSDISTQYDNAVNSICPKGWRLPKGRASSDTATTREFGELFRVAGVTSSLTATSYASGGLNKLRTTPLFFVRSASVSNGSVNGSASYGNYWSSTVDNSSRAYDANFHSSYMYPARSDGRYYGLSVRCLVR